MPRPAAPEFPIFEHLDDSILGVCYLARLEFSQPIYLWSGSYDLPWNNQTWQGNGWLMPPTQVEETSELKATGVEITLSGVPQEMNALVLTELNHSKTLQLYLGITDDHGRLVATPHLVFEGRFDTASIDDSDTESSISLSYESHLIDLSRTNEHRYSHESQIARFPGDMGFAYLETLTEWDGTWMTRTPRDRTKKQGRKERNRK